MKKKQRKPRTKEQPWYYAKHCDYFDGRDSEGNPITECFHPWRNRCDGETHKCLKLKLRWIAGLPKSKQT